DVPSPTGALQTRHSSVSYYNPATVPSPDGGVKSSASAVSYYDPAPLPGAGGTVIANVAAVSYCNPDGTCAPAAPPEPDAPQRSLVTPESSTSAPDDTTSAAFSVSIANGPTATRLAPAQLTHSTINPYTLVIEGANLTGATAVRLLGLESDLSMGVPVVSGDGRQLTVD